MAHKHNRRRVRPRVRQNKQNYYTNNMSYDSLSLQPQFSFPAAQHNRPYSGRHRGGIPQYISGVTDPYCHSRMNTSSPSVPSPTCAINIESERIKMFGGEPGDSEKMDIGLCFKMAEVFEEMDWVNV